MRLPNKFSEQARKEKGKGIMRMGMVFLARFKVHYGSFKIKSICPVTRNSELSNGK